MLDFGGVISKSTFENLERIERGFGLDAGTLNWRGPFDPDTTHCGATCWANDH